MLKKEQIAGNNFAYLRCTFEEFIASMERLDIHAIELYAASPHLFVPESTNAQARNIGRQLREAEIKPICFTAEQCMYPVSLSTEDELVRRRSMRYYMRSLELAQEAGCPRMQMISGQCYLHSRPEENWARAVDGIGAVTERARELGVQIVLEADPACSVATLQDTRRMIDTIGSPYLTGMIDTNEMYNNGEDIRESIRLLGPDLQHMHFIDLKPGVPCLTPGDGILPMEDYLEALAEGGYEAYLSPELWGWSYLNDPHGALERGVRYIENWIERNGGTVDA